MDLNQITIPAIQMQESVNFYLGMGFTQIVDTAHYARFECPEGDGTFSLHLVEKAGAESGFIIYFEVKNLLETVARLKQEGYIFSSDIKEERWLWTEARLKDPYGNTICLFYAGENRKNPPWRVEKTAKSES